MTTTQRVPEFKEYDQMFAKAAEAATASFGRTAPGVFYIQGGRRFISTTLPVPVLLMLAQRNSAPKKGDPSEARNRPLDNAHVKEIAEYLSSEDQYLLPPVMLNSSQRLQIFAFQTPNETKPCVFVLPFDAYLFITDGQHRLEALRRAAESKPELLKDSVGVTIVEEDRLDKVHQDFFDAAQTKALSPSLLVEYDGREPVNGMAREIGAQAIILHDRVERIGGTVGKNSLKLFTSNQVKQAVMQLVVGDWSLYGDAMQKQAEEAIAPARSLWRSRILAFLDEFTSANPQWNEVANRPLESGMITNIPNLRESYLHFTGGGLLVLCGVGHAILEREVLADGTLSSDQREYIYKLAMLDWSRNATLWSGSLVGDRGNVAPHKGNVVLAVARTKKKLGLELTVKESGAMDRAAASAAQREQERQAALVS